jgi:hypothetical protein
MTAALLGGLLFAQSGVAPEQSLGDAARAQRNDKKSAQKRVYTNEDLAAQRPAQDEVSQTKPATSATDKSDKKTDAATTPATDKKSDGTAKAEPAAKKDAAPAETSTGIEEKYRGSIRKQRDTTAALEKEIDDNEHKVQVQSTNYYMDAGARYRDPKAWAEQREKMNKDIDVKREKLAAARAELEKTLEEARKLCIPSSSLE